MRFRRTDNHIFDMKDEGKVVAYPITSMFALHDNRVDITNDGKTYTIIPLTTKEVMEFQEMIFNYPKQEVRFK